MKNSESKLDEASVLLQLSAALFDMRDALNGLSLALKDWQFETDLEQRKASENMVHQLLARLASNRDRPG